METNNKEKSEQEKLLKKLSATAKDCKDKKIKEAIKQKIHSLDKPIMK